MERAVEGVQGQEATAKEEAIFEHLEGLKKQVRLEGLDVVPIRADEVAEPRGS